MVAALGLVAVALVGHAPAEHEVDLMGTWTKPSGIGIDKVQTILSLHSFLFPCTGTFLCYKYQPAPETATHRTVEQTAQPVNGGSHLCKRDPPFLREFVKMCIE